jgi:DNA-binding response OmpR family regulator
MPTEQELLDRIKELETLLGLTEKFPEWDITPAESQILGMLLRRTIVNRETAMAAIYGARPKDPPYDKIIDVHISRLRRRFPGVIQTIWGKGWFIAIEDRHKLSLIYTATKSRNPDLRKSHKKKRT